MIHKKISSLSIEHPYERAAFRLLAGLVAIFAVGYMYFVAASVLNVMARTAYDRQSVAIEGDIGMLEQRYLYLTSAVRQDAAQEFGLVPVNETSYVYRPGPSASLPVKNDVI